MTSFDACKLSDKPIADAHDTNVGAKVLNHADALSTIKEIAKNLSHETNGIHPCVIHNGDSSAQKAIISGLLPETATNAPRHVEACPPQSAGSQQQLADELLRGPR